jgi:lysophospholipase L1-like esterase
VSLEGQEAVDMPQKRGTSFGNRLAVVLGSLVALFLLEAGTGVACWLGLMELPTYPVYVRPTGRRLPVEWIADLSPKWGVWHPSNATYRHQAACFDVRYQSNTYGARDRERSKSAHKPRIILLGDSMVEGYGVADPQRVSEALERLTGKEVLNFATSGSFGPTQYGLLYDHLASTFDHDLVLVGMLPANDFRDDDPAYGRVHYSRRYRPYWTGPGPDYRLTYFVPQITESSYHPAYQSRALGVGSQVRGWMRDYTFSYNAIAALMRIRRRQEGYAGYYDYIPEQWARTRFALHRLAQSVRARGARVAFFLIPAHTDLIRYQQAGAPPLAHDFGEFCRQENVACLDLLPAMAAQPKPAQLYHTCDPHWSPQGHQMAAHALAAFLEREGLHSRRN